MSTHGRGGNYNPTGKRGPLPPAEKTDNMNFRCSKEFKETVKALAKELNLSQGELIEQAVYHYKEHRL
jgi:hypothetical protein